MGKDAEIPEIIVSPQNQPFNRNIRKFQMKRNFFRKNYCFDERFGYTSGGCILFGRFICKFAVFALFGPCGLYKVPSVVVFKSAVSTYQCFVCLYKCDLNLKVKLFKNSKRTEVRLIVVQSGAVNRKILYHSSQEIFGNWLQNNVGSGNEFVSACVDWRARKKKKACEIAWGRICPRFRRFVCVVKSLKPSATLANSIFPREKLHCPEFKGS